MNDEQGSARTGLLRRLVRDRECRRDVVDHFGSGNHRQTFVFPDRFLVAAGHEDHVGETVAVFLAEIGEHAVAAVPRQIGIDDDRGVVLVAQFLDGIPAVGRHVSMQVVPFPRLLDRRGDQGIILNDEQPLVSLHVFHLRHPSSFKQAQRSLRKTFPTRARSTLFFTGLRMKSAAPTANALTSTSSPGTPEMKIAGISRPFSRTACSRLCPSMNGKSTSSSMRSTFWRPIIISASAPSFATTT